MLYTISIVVMATHSNYLTTSSNNHSKAFKQINQSNHTINKNKILKNALAASSSALHDKNQNVALQKLSADSKHKRSSSMKLNSRQLNIKKDFLDLMNDWEIGGTQNPWVCPSDRHLQLRAQLKSGWSVRTATARSSTNVRHQINSGNNSTNSASTSTSGHGLSDAEQEHIKKVLTRAERGRLNEELRIGKMVDRLEKLKSRATGNGVTQCLLCQTEFGLLVSKSYAAMCLNCQKYVCQKNCGVETFDQKRGEPIFLCKICSEYQEVMWKKSGAWFYREMPNFQRPSITDCNINNIQTSKILNSSNALCNGSLTDRTRQNRYYNTQFQSSNFNNENSPEDTFQSTNLLQNLNQKNCSNNDFDTTNSQLNAKLYNKFSEKITINKKNNPNNFFLLYNSLAQNKETSNFSSTKQLLPFFDQQQNLTNAIRPRPIITPSWVHEKVQSSISVGSDFEDEEDEETEDKDDKNDLKEILDKKRRNIVTQSSLSSSSSSTNRNIENLQQQEFNNKKNNNLNQNLVDSTVNKNQNALFCFCPKEAQKQNVSSENQCQNILTENTKIRNKRNTSLKKNLASRKIQLSNTEESENDESRQTTPLMSPRHSIATPSSYGGDDISTSQPTNERLQFTNVSLMTNNAKSNDTFDAKSIDSGVVQSDHSTQQTQIAPENLKSSMKIPVSLTNSNNYYIKQQEKKHILKHSFHQNSSSSSSSPILPSMPVQSSMNNITPPPNTQISSQSQSFIASERHSLTSVDKCDNKPSSSSHLSLTNFNEKLKDKSSLSLRENLYLPKQLSNFQQKFSTVCKNNKSTESLPQQDDAPFLPTSISREQIVSDKQSTKNTQNVTKKSFFSRFSVQEDSTCNNQNNIKTEDNDSSSNLPSYVSSPEDKQNMLGSIQFNLTYLPDEQQLIIHLIKAKNLKAMDKNGFSDPYVKFHLIPGNVKATKLTSKTIEKTLNPIWHEEMIYYGVTKDDRQRKTLRLTVLDRDRIGSDFLGEARVALKKLPLGSTKKFNLYLTNAVFTPVEKIENIERGKILVSICYNIQQASLIVHIKRCAELLGMDSTGFSDPYCKVQLTPLASKNHRQKTCVKKQTLNPEFNSILQFIVPFKDLPKKTLEIKVYDYDVGRHDDYIGGILLSTTAKNLRGTQWRDCIENPGKTYEYWHKLELDT